MGNGNSWVKSKAGESQSGWTYRPGRFELKRWKKERFLPGWFVPGIDRIAGPIIGLEIGLGEGKKKSWGSHVTRS